jgi:hypothetical protein
MSYNLSVVDITADAYVVDINKIAEIYGCGPNSLSVKLVDANGNIFWGCQSYWQPEDYDTFTNPDLRAQMVPADLLPALDHLYERLVLDGDGYTNFMAALSELGLTIWVDPNQTV